MTSLTSVDSAAAIPVQFASLKHRLLCMVYEGVLLFGVLFAAELLFDLSTQKLDSAALHYWHNLYLFLVLGAYFTYFWGHGGQTLPMQTWHIKVVSADFQAVSFKQACIRYCAAWMWFLPALALSYGLDLPHWTCVSLFFVGILVWAFTSKFDKNGQFLHDRLAGTQLVCVAKAGQIDDTN
ncbi:putative RDD family membrane protein YckC [Oxalobacteraceae bacterium GrIS 2.11]